MHIPIITLERFKILTSNATCIVLEDKIVTLKKHSPKNEGGVFMYT